MIQPEELVGALAGRGYGFWAGVPCSFLTGVINHVLESPAVSYYGATSEGEAVALALGAAFADRKAVVLCQNSGLGNAVNPLTSLAYPFRVPLLLLVTQRGAPGVPDEPQHELMGRITTDLLDTMRIGWEYLPAGGGELEQAVARAVDAMERTSLPYAFVVPKDAIAEQERSLARPAARREPAAPHGEFELAADARPTRLAAIRAIASRLDGTQAVVSTTGKTSRELFALGHRPNHVYVVGGMGCASGIGMGFHEASGGRPVVVLDGDGAALMKLGSMATIGHYSPSRLVHVLLDNEVHDSTGAQPTVSGSVDFAAIAMACGYRYVARADRIESAASHVTEALERDGPAFIHVKIKPGSDPRLGRPDRTPAELKTEFLAWAAASSRASLAAR